MHMSTFASFEEMNVWKESRILTQKIRAICKRQQVSKDFPFVDQITRAARSISANIAEGNDSFTVPEFIKFLGIAKRSCAEVRSHLYDALDEKYISPIEFDDISDRAKKICSMLAQLMRYLRRSDTNRRRLNSHKRENE